MFSSNSISEILGIRDKNLKFTGKISNKIINGVKFNILHSTLTYTPDVCPHCGSVNENYSIVKNGSQKVKILINRINNVPTILEVKKQRFCCKHCERTFIAKTALTNKGCFISNDVKISIIDKLVDIISMKTIAKDHYVSSNTVIRVLRSTESKTNKNFLPKKIAIDEFKSTKKVDASMSVNITDIDTGHVFDIVSDRRKKYLGEYLGSFSEEARNNVKIITTDMYPTYIELSKKFFPNALIVLDKFHIVQMFTRNMNKLRVLEMKNFKTYSHEYHVLKRYWKVLLAKDWNLNSIYFYKYTCYKKFTNTKEIKDDILSFSDRIREANIYYQKFLLCIEKRDVEGLKKLVNKDINEIPECFRTSVYSLKKHMKYVINSLSTSYTNAHAEGNNNLIKAYKRVSFGFKSYKNMKLRILLRNRYKVQKNSEADGLFSHIS